MPSKLVRRYKKKRRNPDEGGGGGSSNPTALAEIGEYVLPGFAGFAASRFLTRVAAVQIAKRKPSWGKHAGAVAAVGAFLSAWLLAHRVKQLRKYHFPLVIGSAIAAAQSLVQLYFPSLGWMVADASTELDAGQQIQQLSAGGQQAAAPLPAGLTPVQDDPADYVYNDTFNAGRMDQQQADADAQIDELEDMDQQSVGGY